MIKELREKKGVTQKQLAEYLGLNTQSVSNMERGVSNIPVERAGEIARYFRKFTSKKQVMDYVINYKAKKLIEKARK